MGDTFKKMKKQYKQALVEIGVFTIIICSLNFLIDGLRNLEEKPIAIMYEIARASNDDLKEYSQNILVEHKNDKLVYDKVGEFTAYNADQSQTDDDPNIMASNKEVYKGAVACPIYYNFGTKLDIEGYGIVTCEDRMNIRFRDKEKFDIFMFSYDEAIKFGIKQLRYRIIQ